jgi:predicted ester cyclase
MSSSLEDIYGSYIAAINAQTDLAPFVHSTVIHNGNTMSCAQYMDTIKASFDAAPDLVFNIDQILSSVSIPEKIGQTTAEKFGDGTVSVRICFKATPISTFLGISPLVGEKKQVSFAEHVWYRFIDGKIEEVWSVIDVEGVRKQLGRADNKEGVMKPIGWKFWVCLADSIL